MERAVFVIYVILIDFVGQQEQVMFMGEADDIFDVLASQYLAGWIAGIDHHQHTRITRILDFS